MNSSPSMGGSSSSRGPKTPGHRHHCGASRSEQEPQGQKAASYSSTSTVAYVRCGVSPLSQRSSPMPVAVDFQAGISDAWSNVIAFVPKLAAALVIILVGYLLAKVIAGVLNKVLERVGFDRAVERGGIKQALARSKY